LRMFLRLAKRKTRMARKMRRLIENGCNVNGSLKNSHCLEVAMSD